MNRFDYVRPATIRRGRRRRLRSRAPPISPPAPTSLDLMKVGVARPEPPRRHHAAAGARPDRVAARRRRPHRRAGAQRRPRPRRALRADAFRRSPKRCSRALRRSSATPRRSAATCCSGRAAPISTTRRAPATSAQPGAGCDARGGENRLHAVLGWSEQLHRDAPFRLLRAAGGARRGGRDRGHGGAARGPARRASTACPGDTPERDSVLEPGELIVAVRLPADAAGFRGAMRATSSCASAPPTPSRSSRPRPRCASRAAPFVEARIALGGVAAKPWRAREAEALLAGARADATRIPPRRRRGARRGAGRPATTRFKIELARGIVVRALTLAAAGNARARCRRCPASPFAATAGALSCPETALRQPSHAGTAPTSASR